MAQQNLAVKLCGVLQTQTEDEITAREWRLIGQEQDGSQLFTWLANKNEKEVMNIGMYTNVTKTLSILHTFEEKLNIIQASVNSTHSLLIYVVKILSKEVDDKEEALYCPYLISLLPDKISEPEEVEESSTKQIMVQYINGKSNKYSPGIRNDRFLLFKHLDCIKIYRTPMFLNEFEDGTEKWGFDGIYPGPETIVKVFSWAQWDCVNQVLFYIHYRQPAQSFAEGEEVKSPTEMTPTLSALQFHPDLPYETVLNIPLSLPQAAGAGAACGSYEDDPVPLRVHDCSLDLYIVCDMRGLLCICHHYLYKPLDDSTTSLILEDSAELKESGVNFAYSITLLHHGCVVHSVVPDLPWSRAKSLRPSYTLYEENYLLVNIPMLFTHLIDISLQHEPCANIVIPLEETDTGPSLGPLLGWGAHAMVDLNTLDIVIMKVSEKDLSAAIKSNTSIENKMSIIHYLIQHVGNLELAEELISWLWVNESGGCGGLLRTFQEYLIAYAYATTRRSLPASALNLMPMLPFTLTLKFCDVKVGDTMVLVSQEKLWNSTAVVLAPRQRVSQFTEDTWTRLWSALTTARPRRLRPLDVVERLRLSLHCYQPEALSRCSTPLSPTASTPLLPRRSSSAFQDGLPFLEVDVCTASKQEHVIAANQRAVSVHVMRERGEAGECGAEGGVHALATRWSAAQLDAARSLCRAATRAFAVPPHQRGSALVDEMECTQAMLLYKSLEQYWLATESVAFPQPAGFSSFLTYLGYRTQPFSAFMYRVHRKVLELHIDVLKAIVVGTVNADKKEDRRTVNKKLRLLLLSGDARGRRALSAWQHKSAVQLRARHHAAALLSGSLFAMTERLRPTAQRERIDYRSELSTLDASNGTKVAGIAAMPSGERLSPLDTFLDLLTAKASLNELDFNLIIDATIASLQQEVSDGSEDI